MRRFGMIFGALASILSAGSIAAAPPVEGDAGLLRVLRDAQATNRAGYRRGRVAGSVDFSKPSGGFKGDVEVIWDGPYSRVTYSYLDAPQSGGAGSIAAPPPIARSTVITSRAESIHYFPDNRFAQRVAPGGPGYRDELKVRPTELWFGMERLVDWRKVFSPEEAHDGISKYRVSRNGDAVVVEQHFKNGAVFSVTASLAVGAQVVAYETVRVPTNEDRNTWMSRDGRFEWTLAADGTPWLKRLEYRRSPPGDPKGEGIRYLFEVREFSPDPDIPRNFFTLAGLKLPKGTKVEAIGMGGQTTRSYIVGGKEPAITAAKLDELSRDLKSGFAAPEREGK